MSEDYKDRVKIKLLEAIGAAIARAVETTKKITEPDGPEQVSYDAGVIGGLSIAMEIIEQEEP